MADKESRFVWKPDDIKIVKQGNLASNLPPNPKKVWRFNSKFRRKPEVKP